MRFSLVLATLACCAVAFAAAGQTCVINDSTGVEICGFTLDQPQPLDVTQIAYISNLNQGDADVNITNGGSYGAFLGLNSSIGDICANIYVFDPAQEMLACCSCLVTPDGLNTFSVKNDLVSHTLTPAVPTSVVIKLVSTLAFFSGPTCKNSAASLLPNALGASGMRAWATTLHQNNTGGYSVTENAFQSVNAGAVELSSLSQMCGFVLAEGSGNFGFCNAVCAPSSIGLSGE
jgi:hypothetical protein